MDHQRENTHTKERQGYNFGIKRIARKLTGLAAAVIVVYPLSACETADEKNLPSIYSTDNRTAAELIEEHRSLPTLYEVSGLYDSNTLVGIVFDISGDEAEIIPIRTNHAFKKRDLGIFYTDKSTLDEFVKAKNGKLTKITMIGDQGVAYTLPGIDTHLGVDGSFKLSWSSNSQEKPLNEIERGSTIKPALAEEEPVVVEATAKGLEKKCYFFGFKVDCPTDYNFERQDEEEDRGTGIAGAAADTGGQGVTGGVDHDGGTDGSGEGIGTR